MQKHISVCALPVVSYGTHQALLMLRAYFDESGHYTDPGVHVIGIGGWCAPLEAWERFEATWIATLRDSEFQIPEGHEFHANSFAQRQGDFKDWPEQRRQNLLARLMGIISRDAGMPIGTVIAKSTYNGASQILESLTNPYYGCLIFSLKNAAEYLDRLQLPEEEQVEIICDEQGQFSSLALRVFQQIREDPTYSEISRRLASIAFAPSCKVVPLQAADLMIYELRRYWSDRLKGHERIRWPMQQIIRKGTDYLRFLSSRVNEGRI